MVRYWLTFLVLLGAFHASLTVGEPFWRALDAGTARLLARCLTLLGHGASAHRDVVTSSLCSVTIVHECTAVHPIAIFIAAVIAYPLAWTARLSGIAVGVPTLLIINQVRLVSLCYIDRWHPTSFEAAHLLVWQSLIVLSTALLFVVWVFLTTRR
jgi:archaeosortase B (VPXXXP-CTERM-specific)